MEASMARADPNSAGQPLPEPLLPPDLIIQDELHLISGPLGTMVGLYETPLTPLQSRNHETKRTEKIIRPKSLPPRDRPRADRKIKALFCRNGVEIFPCPGPNVAIRTSRSPCQQSKSRGACMRAWQQKADLPKVIFLRTYLALLGAAQKGVPRQWWQDNQQNRLIPT